MIKIDALFNIHKYEGEFGGFRRVANSYNQNWRWDE